MVPNQPTYQSNHERSLQSHMRILMIWTGLWELLSSYLFLSASLHLLSSLNQQATVFSIPFLELFLLLDNF